MVNIEYAKERRIAYLEPSDMIDILTGSPVKLDDCVNEVALTEKAGEAIEAAAGGYPEVQEVLARY